MQRVPRLLTKLITLHKKNKRIKTIPTYDVDATMKQEIGKNLNSSRVTVVY